MSYATTNQVYSLIGIDSLAIPEATINDYILQATAEVEKIIKTTCSPRIIIEKFAGKGTNTEFLKNKPLLNILSLNIEDTDVSTKYIQIKETGEAFLTTSAEEAKWSSKDNSCKIKYTFGWLEEDSSIAQESLTSDYESGTNKTISVTDAKNYPINSYIKIEGLDGNYEIVKIIACNTTTNIITVNLNQDHESGSLVTKMKVPQIVSNLTAVLAAIKGANYMIGNTYTFATNYSMPDYSVTKGVPYPHFNRNLEQNIAQRDYLIKQLAPVATFA